MPSGAGQNRRTIAEARHPVGQLFRNAVKIITRRDEAAPKPAPRRKSGETDKGLAITARALLSRAVRKTGAAARGRYAAMQPAKPAQPAKAEPEAVAFATDPYAGATVSLSTTLDWLNMWQANAESQWIDEDFSAKQDQYFPQP